jgi:hypothetical protein
MDLLVHIAVGWIALSVMLVVAWTRFMEHLRCKEHALAKRATFMHEAPLEPRRTLASASDHTDGGSDVWSRSQHVLDLARGGAVAR